ncbi:hypothetical protein [Anabaena azotica]|uniref:hypothetical protein n=1 Tax=Anabaena azotica TaxID=197653 RepID=UPI0039A6C3C8
MKTCNENHLKIANQDSNINQGEDKINSLKIFTKSKGLPKSCSRFLSSIVTLSILGIANSCYAGFPAHVAEDRKVQLGNMNGSEPKDFYKQGRKLEIEDCQKDSCTVEAVYEEAPNEDQVRWTKRQLGNNRVVEKSFLCDNGDSRILNLCLFSIDNNGDVTQLPNSQKKKLSVCNKLVDSLSNSFNRTMNQVPSTFQKPDTETLTEVQQQLNGFVPTLYPDDCKTP